MTDAPGGRAQAGPPDDAQAPVPGGRPRFEDYAAAHAARSAARPAPSAGAWPPAVEAWLARLPWRPTPRVLGAALGVVALAVLASSLGGGLSYDRYGARPGPGRKAVVFLHGHGGSKGRSAWVGEDLAQRLPQAATLVPSAPFGGRLGGHRWLDGPSSAPSAAVVIAALEASRDRSCAAIHALVRRLHEAGVRPADVTLAGFSEGAVIALEAALRAPPAEQPGALVLIGGGFMHIRGSGGRQDLPPAPAAGRPPLRALVAHGARDRVMSPSGGRATAEHLAAGGHPTWWLAYDGDHELTDAVRAALAGFSQGEPAGERLPGPDGEVDDAR